jgi:hypothetical protein
MQIADHIRSHCRLNKFHILGDVAVYVGVLAYLRYGIGKADGSGYSTLNKYCK